MKSEIEIHQNPQKLLFLNSVLSTISIMKHNVLLHNTIIYLHKPECTLSHETKIQQQVVQNFYTILDFTRD